MTIQLLPASILGAITVIAVLCLIFRWFGLKKVRSFYVWVSILAVLGGAWAFLFPLAINADFSKNGDGAALRQMLIYTTGGVLGVITLGENHRKNSLEKAKTTKNIYDRYMPNGAAGTQQRLNSFPTIKLLSALAVSTLS